MLMIIMMMIPNTLTDFKQKQQQQQVFTKGQTRKEKK